MTTSVMAESDILRRPMLHVEGTPARVTKPSAFFLLKEFLKNLCHFFFESCLVILRISSTNKNFN